MVLISKTLLELRLAIKDNKQKLESMTTPVNVYTLANLLIYISPITSLYSKRKTMSNTQEVAGPIS